MVHHRSALPYQYGCDPPRTLEPSVRSCAVPRCDTSLEFDDSATANGGLSRERQPRLLFDASAAPADERAAEAAERFGGLCATTAVRPGSPRRNWLNGQVSVLEVSAGWSVAKGRRR